MYTPLHLANEGRALQVVHVDGTAPIRTRLTELGFTPGVKVCVISKNNECVIVKVRDSRIMLNCLMACRVNVQ